MGVLVLACCGHSLETAPSLAGDDVRKAIHVLLIALYQHHVGGVMVAEQGDSVDGGLLEVPERLSGYPVVGPVVALSWCAPAAWDCRSTVQSKKKPPEVRRLFRLKIVCDSSADQDECWNPDHQQNKGDQ